MSRGEAGTFSRKATTPSTIPDTGSAAVIPGSDACRGAELNALCISHSAMMPTATRL